MAVSLRHLAVLVAGMFSSLSASRAAQDFPAASVEIEVRFTVFGANPPGVVRFVPSPGEGPVDLRFMSSQRSRVYEYRGPNPVIFFAEIRLPPDPARPGVARTDRVTVARAVIAPGVREALLFFSVEPGWEKQPVPRYLVQTFDDSRVAVPLGHVTFLNATGLPLFGTIGNQELIAPVGLSPGVRVNLRQTEVVLNVASGSETIRVYEDLIVLDPRQRLTVVLYPPDGPDAVRVQRRLLYDPDHLPVLPRASAIPSR